MVPGFAGDTEKTCSGDYGLDKQGFRSDSLEVCRCVPISLYSVLR